MTLELKGAICYFVYPLLRATQAGDVEAVAKDDICNR